MNKSFLYLFILLSGMFVVPLAHADTNQALMALFKALHENGTIDKDVYQLIVQVANQETITGKVVVTKKDVKKSVQKDIYHQRVCRLPSSIGFFPSYEYQSHLHVKQRYD